MKHFSHKINSALATIFSSVELLEIFDTAEYEKSNKNKKHYSIIKAQTIEITKLVEGLFARLKE